MINRKRVIDQLFIEVTGDQAYKCSTSKSKSFSVDVYHDDTRYVLYTELPGCNSSDIEINYDNNYLEITANKVGLDAEGLTLLRNEIGYGRLKRSFFIKGIDPDNIKADYSKGILRVEIQKLKEEQSFGK